MEIIQQMQEVFGDLEHLTPEKIKLLIQNTLEFFKELQGKIASGDAQLKAQAMEQALQLKAALEKQMEALAKMVSLDPNRIASLLQQAAPASEKDAAALAEIQKDLEEYRKQILPPKDVSKTIKLTC